MKNNIEFTWRMKEEEFERLQKDLKSKIHISDNVYGSFGAGRFWIDILIMDYEGDDALRFGDNVLVCYCFVAGLNSGYAVFPNGVPYDLVKSPIVSDNIIIDRSFDEFKESCEKEILRCACDNTDFVKDWYGWLTSSKYADTVNEFWYNVA